ncbi:MAG: Ni/Fe hydrogenase subunit alpha [Bacillota bacterium]|nr:Ni/Fe hydrogenase subunit alpha [Bacillota bacterium]
MPRISREHLARVEGHGAIEVAIDGEAVREVKVRLFEGARLFEALLVGRRYDEVTSVAMRICAICSAGHTVTSLKAIEKAFGLRVSPQTELLRELLFLGQMIESHALHVFCLALPDYLGYAGALPLAADHPEEVKLGLWLKKVGNAIQEEIGGRAVHPVNAVVGGFGRLPSQEALRRLQGLLEEAVEQSDRVVALMKSLQTPDFCQSPNVYVALRPEGGRFGFFGETIVTSTGETKPVSAYREVCGEEVVRHSHAKQSRLAGKPFMVGALARLSLHGHLLGGRARAAMDQLLRLPSQNILDNNAAQAVELIFSLERALAIVKHLLAEGLVEEKPVAVVPRAGTGTAATEVPRGTLYHSYTFDQQGYLVAADIVTPTAQNSANMEKDVRAATERLLAGLPLDQIGDRLEMVIRAYDPCISCAVHLLDLRGASAAVEVLAPGEEA